MDLVHSLTKEFIDINLNYYITLVGKLRIIKKVDFHNLKL